MFTTFEQHEEKISLAGNKKYIIATGKGNVNIRSCNIDITLRDALYCSELQASFMSISKAVERGYISTFKTDAAYIKDKYNRNVIEAVKQNNLFVVVCDEVPKKLYATNFNWHDRYGHLNNKSLECWRKMKCLRV